MRNWIAALALALGLCGVEGRADDRPKTLPDPMPQVKPTPPEAIPAPKPTPQEVAPPTGNGTADHPPAAPAPAPGCGGGCQSCGHGHGGSLLDWLLFCPAHTPCCHCCYGHRATPLYLYFMCHPCYEGFRPACASCAGGCNGGCKGGCAGH